MQGKFKFILNMEDTGKHCSSCSQISAIELHRQLRWLSFTSPEDNEGIELKAKC